MECFRNLFARRGLGRWIVAGVLLVGAGGVLLDPRAAALFGTNASDSGSQEVDKGPAKKLANGLYGVLREGPQEKAVLPIKDGETLAVQNHRFLKKDENEAPVFLAVPSLPDVPLVLVGEPQVVKGATGGLLIRLKLHPDHAKTLERFTRDKKGGKVAVIIGGEVVTVHHIRDVITGGNVEVSNCDEKAGAYLLKQLQDLSKNPQGKADEHGVKHAEIFAQVLPKGDFRKVSAITVEFGPGAQSPKHRHDVAVFAYVLQGTVESQLEGEKLKTFKEGEMWYEPPGTVHVVSRNASKTERAKLLVFFVQEEGKTPTIMLK